MRAISIAVVVATLAMALTALSGPAYTHEEDAAIGVPGDPKKPARTIRITMKEIAPGKMSFAPDRIAVRRGEQVRFVIDNAGTLDHELVIGVLKDNLAHAEEMKRNPDMEHDDPNMITLSPKKNGEILWVFTHAGTFDFSCLIPGHRESGMHGTITVR